MFFELSFTGSFFMKLFISFLNNLLHSFRYDIEVYPYKYYDFPVQITALLVTKLWKEFSIPIDFYR